MNRSDRSRSFGAQADVYDRVRPSYPAAAVDAVLPRHARRVADVGAGTGKLAAILVDRGLEVIAVEPNRAMRAVLTARLPGVQARAGVAERLPLADAAIDAVLYGQACSADGPGCGESTPTVPTTCAARWLCAGRNS